MQQQNFMGFFLKCHSFEIELSSLFSLSSWRSPHWIFIACFGFPPTCVGRYAQPVHSLCFYWSYRQRWKWRVLLFQSSSAYKYSIRRHLLFILWIINSSSQCSEVVRKFSLISGSWILLGFFLIHFWTLWELNRDGSQEGTGLLQLAVRNLELCTSVSTLAPPVPSGHLSCVLCPLAYTWSKCMKGTRDGTASVTSPRWTGLWTWCCWR